MKSFEKEDLEKAIEHFTKSLKYKKSGEVYYYRGLANHYLENEKDALKDVKKALKMGYEDAAKQLKEMDY